MIDLLVMIRQSAANAEAIRALVQTVSEEQAKWKPGPDQWSLEEVMGHVYNEERIDFRLHLKEMLHEPPLAWGTLHEQWIAEIGIRQALEGFVSERKDSISWLQTLASPDWDITSEMFFGPTNDKMTLRAGDVLVSWVEHDYLHIRQINELLHGWNVKQAAPYSVGYAGGW